jgi:hypothetical protein
LGKLQLPSRRKAHNSTQIRANWSLANCSPLFLNGLLNPAVVAQAVLLKGIIEAVKSATHFMKRNFFETAFEITGGIVGITLLFAILLIGVAYDSYHSATSSIARTVTGLFPRRKRA